MLDFYMNFIAFINNFLDYDYYLMNISLITMSTYMKTLFCEKSLITGVTGQDGSYLAELLLDKGYEVHGIKRRSSSLNSKRVDHIYEYPQLENQRFKLHYGDLTDTSNLIRLLSNIEPDEIYNLGAQSHVAVVLKHEYTADVNGVGTLRLLEGIRILGLERKLNSIRPLHPEL